MRNDEKEGEEGIQDDNYGNGFYRGVGMKTYAVMIHTVKKVKDFPVSSWDVTNQTLTNRELLNYSRPQGEFGQ